MTFNPLTAGPDRLMKDRIVSEDLDTFLCDNNISCSTCTYYTTNNPVRNCIEGVCQKEQNKQNSVYGSVFLRPSTEKFACSYWEEYL